MVSVACRTMNRRFAGSARRNSAQQLAASRGVVIRRQRAVEYADHALRRRDELVEHGFVLALAFEALIAGMGQHRSWSRTRVLRPPAIIDIAGAIPVVKQAARVGVERA